ncbi:hypothetical protein A9Q84_13310 [Halobacteriovorax marinus]|uniref:HNH nuclease domain-containing protein n=1 Tax=Halobacteriovorax marinus TaxID=97084 RepID=A0A1Y5F8S6_9BACT|nr:hypothetical protein A9Q84_13310 [Halobacteriovorax marinus]
MNETHRKLLKLVRQEREILCEVLAHLQVIQDEKIFLKLGYSSLLKYCTQELKYSESAAYRRIKTLKLCKEVPSVKDKIKTGAINLTNASVAQSLFERARCRNVSQKEVILKSIENSTTVISENTVRETLSLPKRKYHLTLITEEKTINKWTEVKKRMAHFGLNEAELFEKLLDEKLNAMKACSAKPLRRKTSKNQRYVSANERAHVFKRAKHCCEYRDKVQRKTCGSVYALEIDHIRPIALGGKSELSNLRLLCRAHNQRDVRLEKI